MTYRDDRDALLARVDALEGDLERAKHEAERLRAENDALRQPPPHDEPDTDTTEQPTALVTRAATPLAIYDNEPFRMIGAVGAAGFATFILLGLLGLHIALALPVALAASSLTWFMRRRSERPPPLPFDKRALRAIVAQRRRAVILKLDVRFGDRIPRPVRDQFTAKLAASDLRPRWENDQLTLTSRRLRCGVKQPANYDPAPIHNFVERALAELVALDWPSRITSIVPRTGQ